MNLVMSLVFAALILAALAPAASASQQGILAMKRWQTMDLCTKQAQTAFPDFTAEANLKRDAKLKECLAGQNLPPRAPMQ